MAILFPELTGQVTLLGVPQQATKKLWFRELILTVQDAKQPGEGEIKIQFSGEQMALLDIVQTGDIVTVGISIRGVEYNREGITKYLIVLLGQHLRVHQAFQRKPAQSTMSPSAASSPSDWPAPGSRRLGSQQRSSTFDEEPPF